MLHFSTSLLLITEGCVRVMQTATRSCFKKCLQPRIVNTQHPSLKSFVIEMFAVEITNLSWIKPYMLTCTATANPLDTKKG